MLNDDFTTGCARNAIQAEPSLLVGPSPWCSAGPLSGEAGLRARRTGDRFSPEFGHSLRGEKPVDLRAQARDHLKTSKPLDLTETAPPVPHALPCWRPSCSQHLDSMLFPRWHNSVVSMRVRKAS
jgi:hypothetical protein